MAAVFKYASCLAAIALFCISCAGTPQKSADSAPDQELALFESAERLFEGPGYESALELYERYLELYPDSAMVPAALLRKGMIHARVKQYESARKVYNQLAENFPGTDFAMRAELEILFSYLAEGLYDRVLEHAGGLDRDRYPQAVAVHMDLASADACMGIGSYDEAFDLYMEAFYGSSGKSGAAAGRRLAEAGALIDPGRLEKKIEALAGRPPAGYLVYARGLALAGAGYTGEAAAIFSGFAKRFPGHELSAEAACKIEEFGKSARFHGRRIGVLLPLTGEYAVFGKNALNGIKLALAEYRTRGGPGPLPEIAVHDTGPGEARAAAGVASLAARKVAAIIALAVNADEAAKEADKMEIPFISMSQKPEITGIGDYVFRNFLTSERQVEALVDYAMGELGIRRFAVLYPDEAYGKSFQHLFAQALDRRGGILAGAELYDPGATDFSGPIIRMGAISPEKEDDRRFNAGSPRVAGLIIPQLRYYDISDAPVLGTNLWHSRQLIEIAGRELGRVVIPEGFYSGSGKKNVQDFVENYEAKYGNTPGIIEASAYDSAALLFDLMEDPGVQDRKTLRDMLLAMPAFDGVTGSTGFDAGGEAIKSIYLLEASTEGFSEIH
ncbi:MAG: ABC transporter substrate-binding protein [Desulfosalsimonas sp.]